jgi:hypothetical protein
VPWFKIDDGFHCHPKVMDAGTPAVGLYVRCGSWVAQQVTDGVVPKRVVKQYGTARQARALVDAGLWHEHGHDCGSCPEVDANSYLIHQYLERNPSRIETDLARDAKTKRQQKWREGKKNPQASNGIPPTVDASTPRHRDAAPAPTRPDPVTSYGSNRAAADQQPAPGLPDGLADLKRAVAAAGLQGIAWDLRESAWEYTRQAMDRVGVAAMVAFAVNSSRLKGQPAGASAWVGGWRSLEPVPEPAPGGEVSYLPAIAGAAPVLPFAGPMTRQQREQQATDDLFGAAMQRAQARMQQEGTAG